MFVAAHPGRPEILTDWMDPSVIDETDITSCDPELDMYDPANGPPYSDEFLRRYRAAQRQRNDRLTSWCIDELQRLGAAGINDQLFVMRRTWADPRFVDPTIDPSERTTPWCYLGDPAKANRGVFGIGTVGTLRSWLNMWSLTESDCRGAAHVARLDIPTLLVQPDADNGVFPSQAAEIFNAIATSDKQFVTLPGDHYFSAATEHRESVADCIVAWLADRQVSP